ncbi:MAG: hypothetical protein KDI98_03740 [Hyphomicrobiaceae bacterium]|nr:hypothetical protein [Hyphomicrobiaceae bacterium]
MTRHLPEEMIANVKDGLRQLRHFARQKRGMSLVDAMPGGSGQQLARRALEEAAGALDEAWRLAGDVARELAPADHPARAGAVNMKGLAIYFPKALTAEAERAFRRDFYHGAKALLSEGAAPAVTIEEAALVGTWEAEGAAVARLCAADQSAEALAVLLLRLMESRPLKPIEDMGPTHLRQLTAAVMAPLVLACGLAGKPGIEDEDDAPQMLAIAVHALRARGDRLNALIAGADARRELTAMFQLFLQHLP